MRIADVDRPALGRGIPPTVWALGLVSLLMDISSEIVHSLLPIFLVTALGVGVQTVGVIEGVAEGTVMVVRSFSGALSDRLGRRKGLAVVGYGLGALSKPLFALASGVGLVVGARIIDRIGKGIRGAPRDALVADVTPPHLRGAAYGLRQSLDTVGAFLGPLAAIGLMAALGGNFRAVFWVAVLPGLAAVAVLLLAVREPVSSGHDNGHPSFTLRDLAGLGTPYWLVVGVGATFTLARFSEAFLLLRAGSMGLAAGLVPVILVAMNVAYAATAYPAGRLSDRLGRAGLMAAGLIVLIAADLLLAWAQSTWSVLAGAAMWGVHMGLTQGLLAAWVADTASAHMRGTAFGVFGLLTGVALFLASTLAGWLWVNAGAPATFLTGAALAAASLIGFLVLHWRGKIS